MEAWIYEKWLLVQAASLGRDLSQIEQAIQNHKVWPLKTQNTKYLLELAEYFIFTCKWCFYVITFSKKCKCSNIICRHWKQKCSHKNLCAPRLCPGVKNCVEGDTPMTEISRNGSEPCRNNGSSLGTKLQTAKTDCMQPVLSNRFELLILQLTDRLATTRMCAWRKMFEVLKMFNYYIHPESVLTSNTIFLTVFCWCSRGKLMA